MYFETNYGALLHSALCSTVRRLVCKYGKLVCSETAVFIGRSDRSLGRRVLLSLYNALVVRPLRLTVGESIPLTYDVRRRAIINTKRCRTTGQIQSVGRSARDATRLMTPATTQYCHLLVSPENQSLYHGQNNKTVT